jgi:glucokinase
VIGVDLGGTNVRAQALYQDGSDAGSRVELPSYAQSGTAAIMDQVAAAVSEASKGLAEVPEAVGMAIPGHVDDVAGLVKWSPNLGHMLDGVFHYWKDVPVRALMSERTKLKLVMANDANCAALGEYMYGSGKGDTTCLVMFTLGTGIGSGVVLGGPSVQGGVPRPLLLLGGNKGGVEFGHMVVHKDGPSTTAGTYGTVESYCQRDRIVERAVYRLMRGRPSKLHSMCSGDFSLVSPKMIDMAADEGDELAREVWAEVGSFLGVAVGNAVNVFAPSVVAIGGQIAKGHPYFMPTLMREAHNTAIPTLMADCQVVPAELIENAGLMGAGALAFQAVGG